MTAAHKTLPFGTLVRVTHQRSGRSVVVRINDRGPFVRGRVIDVTSAAARALGFSGLAPVTLAVVGRQVLSGRAVSCPLWVISGRSHRNKSCPLCPRKRTFAVHLLMSAMGQKQTFAPQKAMSALPPKADIVCDKVRTMKPVTIASVRAHGARQ